MLPGLPTFEKPSDTYETGQKLATLLEKLFTHKIPPYFLVRYCCKDHISSFLSAQSVKQNL